MKTIIHISYPAVKTATRKLLTLAVAILAVFTAAGTSFAQGMAPAWTSSGSAGSIIDATSIINSAAGNSQEGENGSVTFKTSRAGNITLRYNVVNTAVQPMGRSTGRPPWTTFEMAYIMPDTTTITAILYELPKCSQTAVAICQIPTVMTNSVRCDACTFLNNTFDYFNNIYFIEVTMARPTTNVAPPAVCSLRVFN